jgi:type IV secretory pathway TrbD component
MMETANQLGGIFGGAAGVLALLLGLLTVSSEVRLTFWKWLIAIVQLGMVLIGLYVWYEFRTASGDPSRAEISNCALWGFNIVMYGKFFIENSVALLKKKPRPA